MVYSLEFSFQRPKGRPQRVQHISTAERDLENFDISLSE